MFCSKCGSQIPDIASFCANCGAPVDNRVAPVVSKKLTRKEWINQGGNFEAAKEIKVMKILSYTTIAILCVLFVLTIVGYVIMITKINEAFGGNTNIDSLYFVMAYMGGLLALSLLFGILGAQKYRTGFSITYLIFGELSFLFSVGQLLGGGLHNLALMAVMAVPFSFIIAMQVKINKKYKAAKKQL